MASVHVSLCECGCGQPAPIARYTKKRDGAVKGQPLRFIRFHHGGRPVDTSPGRFWAFVQKTDGCWPWTGHMSPEGYGLFKVRGKQAQAHRYAYELTYGPLPKEQLACHKCDVHYPVGDTSYRKCCRPDHLFAGTTLENIADRNRKGRTARGRRSNRGKVPDETVRAIRAAHAELHSYMQVAAAFGMPVPTVKSIIRRHSYAYVE